MARVHVKVDYKGVSEVAKKQPELVALIEELTERVADNVRDQGITVGAFSGGGEIDLPVETSQKVTDRTRGVVTLAHPAGLAVQAKHGSLTRAAAEAGLQVKAP